MKWLIVMWCGAMWRGECWFTASFLSSWSSHHCRHCCAAGRCFISLLPGNSRFFWLWEATSRSISKVSYGRYGWLLCVVADFWFAASPHHRHIVAFLFFLVSLARLLICLHGLWRLSDTRWGCWIIVPRYVSPCPATKLGPAISQLRSCLFCTCLTYVFASLCMWLAGGRGGCPWNNPDPHSRPAFCWCGRACEQATVATRSDTHKRGRKRHHLFT